MAAFVLYSGKITSFGSGKRHTSFISLSIQAIPGSRIHGESSQFIRLPLLRLLKSWDIQHVGNNLHQRQSERFRSFSYLHVVQAISSLSPIALSQMLKSVAMPPGDVQSFVSSSGPQFINVALNSNSLEIFKSDRFSST